MNTPIDRDQWQAVRESLRRLGDAFADLVAATTDPRAPGVGKWSVAETAAHVLGIVELDLGLVDAAEEPPSPYLPEVLRQLPSLTVDDINGLNEVVLQHLCDRDPALLADALHVGVDRLLRVTESRDPQEPMPWVGGSKLPLAGLLAHLVNEILLHGYDLGRATGESWPMTSRDAAPFFEFFIAGLARLDVGRLLDGGDRPRERRIAVEFRSPHTTPVTLVLRAGRVTAERPSGSPDVRLRFDPLTMSMMMFGRMSRARAVLTGGVRIGGRRPWLLPVFLKTFRVPG
jgi:hypothetical protein